MNIGWATRDITPAQPVILRGQFHLRISEQVRDPLTVTALVLDGQSPDGQKGQTVMVSCDFAGIAPDIHQHCREMLKERLPQMDVSRLMLNATHTHTAPETRDEAWPPQPPEVMRPSDYEKQFVEGIVGAVEEAWHNRRPGGVSWMYGNAVVGHNRRLSYMDGSAKMYGNTNDSQFSHIEGYEDHGLDLLLSWDEANRPTGIIVNLACPSQETESARYVSADFWHETRVELRRLLGDELFVLPQCSAAGDQSPHLLLHKAAEDRMLQLRGIDRRQEIAERIAAGVARVMPVAHLDIRRDVPLAHTVRTIELPRRMVTDEEYAEALAEIERLEVLATENMHEESVRFCHLNRNRRNVARYELQKTQKILPIELQVVRLGDIAFATNPFELFLDYGLRIKARSKALQTFVIQLSGNGAGSEYSGYLPTARAMAGASYGAQVTSNMVGPQGGQMLVEETLKSIDLLWS